jgi:hypothetical protein
VKRCLILAALAPVAAGCGGSGGGSALATRFCERAQIDRTSRQRALAVLGSPEHRSLIRLTDIEGKPYSYEKLSWGGAALVFSTRHSSYDPGPGLFLRAKRC